MGNVYIMWQVREDYGRRMDESSQKLLDLQTLHDALMCDNDSYQQLVQRLSTDNARLDELLHARTDTADQLQDEVTRLRAQLDDSRVAIHLHA